MATALLKWIRRRGIRASTYPTKYKAYGKQERKDLKLKKIVNKTDNYKKLAYAMAASIKKKGIEPTYFLTRAIEATKREQKKKYANALKLDIIEALNQN